MTIRQSWPIATSAKRAPRLLKRLGKKITNHTFRATGITTFLEKGGTLERAQIMANHSSVTTTQLYDRRGKNVTKSDVERIQYD